MGRYALAIAIGCVALYAVHCLLLWMERKGWVYYRHARGSGSLGNVFLPVQAIYQPEVNYVLEERARDDAEQDESGDPPFPGGAPPNATTQRYIP